eukprot:COSAG06_NODE_9563_length_1870_cov_1.399209_1_plen_115_part_10
MFALRCSNKPRLPENPPANTALLVHGHLLLILDLCAAVEFHFPRSRVGDDESGNSTNIPAELLEHVGVVAQERVVHAFVHRLVRVCYALWGLITLIECPEQHRNLIWVGQHPFAV